MARLGVRLTARQRVSMGTGAGKAFHTTTHRHVPGSVLRGAIAAAWVNRRGAPDPDFRSVFDRDLRFGPLLAAGTSLRPLSVRSCKYGPAHCGQGDGRWYWDAAFPLPGGQPGVPDDWDSPAGHWQGGRGEVVGNQTSPFTSTAIDPATGSAAERQLFSRDALPAETVFTGVVAGEQEALEVLAKALAELDRLEIGGRSSVLGSARIALVDAPPVAPPGALAAERVVLRLSSPAFVVDAAGRPVRSDGLLAELRRLGYAGRVERSVDGAPRVWSRPLTDGTGGFHAATRLPKPVDTGMASGTTVVLRPAPGDAEVLAAILGTGVGLRRPEGFGFLEVAAEPWEMPGAPSGDAETQEPGPAPDGGFGPLLARVHALDLSQAQRRWFIARLGDAAGVPLAQREEAVGALMLQPGAAGLSSSQRQTVTRILTEQPAEWLRRLADALRGKEPQ